MQNISDQISFQVYQNQEDTFQFHETMLVFFGLHGRCHIFSGNTEYELQSAGILVINPFELYRLTCPIDGTVLCMQISRSVLQLCGWKDTDYCSCYAHSGKDDREEYDQLRKDLATIFHMFFEKNGDVSGSVMGLVLQFMGRLQTYFCIHDLESMRNERNMQRLKRILDRIHERWNEAISLSQIAQEEYLSASYLSRFFQKNLNISFSQYVKELRMRNARRMLIQSEQSVTHIAYDCGFRTPSMFIETFRQYYGVTPKQYRRDWQKTRSQQSISSLLGNDLQSDLSALMIYMRGKQKIELPRRTQQFTVHCAAQPIESQSEWRKILNIGYARDGLLAPVQEQICRAQREIKFEYLRFHGLFDRDMNVYFEDENGTPRYDFSYINLLFDFIVSQNLKPYVELSFMPSQLAREQTRIFDRPSIISGCTDLRKWALLVQAVLRNFIVRYGSKIVRQWRFTTISQSYVHIGCILPEDYDALYCTTFRAVKEVDPLLCMGGPGCFAHLITEKEGVPHFLEMAEENACLPDFISIQGHPHAQVAETELFMDFTLSQKSAPAIISKDASFLKHSIDSLKEKMAQYGLEDREIYLEESNATLWQRDLSSETCYKAVWIAKNVCENRSQMVFGYWLLTDFLEERAMMESIFHGGYGLMTYNGVPKAGYWAMYLLSKLGSEKVATGDDWLLTRNSQGYQLVVYNYCHYSNLYRYRYQRLKQPEEAYSVFETGEIKRMQFHILDVEDGLYRVERYRITRDHGSSFDKWLEMGAPDYPNMDEVQYLAENSRPAYQLETIQARKELRVGTLLNPLETELLILQPLHQT